MRPGMRKVSWAIQLEYWREEEAGTAEDNVVEQLETVNSATMPDQQHSVPDWLDKVRDRRVLRGGGSRRLGFLPDAVSSLASSMSSGDLQRALLQFFLLVGSAYFVYKVFVDFGDFVQLFMAWLLYVALFLRIVLFGITLFLFCRLLRLLPVSRCRFLRLCPVPSELGYSNGATLVSVPASSALGAPNSSPASSSSSGTQMEGTPPTTSAGEDLDGIIVRWGVPRPGRDRWHNKDGTLKKRSPVPVPTPVLMPVPEESNDAEEDFF